MSNLADLDRCPDCASEWKYTVEKLDAEKPVTYSHLIGVEYSYGSPEHYDGVSEWMCPACGTRWGRWSGRRLAKGEVEPRYGRVL